MGKILAQAYDTAAYKIAADDLLAAHKVDILFHALGAGVVMHDERRINALMVETKAGRQAVLADIFIDCSGDGDLAAWAGARYEVGDNNGSMLYPSMMFRLNGIDPHAYLRHVLERIAEHPINRIEELLPWRVADLLPLALSRAA